jgi:hypothetical protein
MEEEKVTRLDAFLLWVDNKVCKSNDFDALTYKQIAEIASEEFSEEFTEEHIGVALSEISKRKNYYIAPWAAGDSPPPAEPA